MGTGLIAAVAATKIELVGCFVFGVLFPVSMFLLRPLTMRMTRDEANRVIFSETKNLSTYVLMGLASGAWFGGLLIAWTWPLGEQECELAPSLGKLIVILLIVGVTALSFMSRLVMKRLAKQVIVLRASPRTH